jgi:hypothetical protein
MKNNTPFYVLFVAILATSWLISPDVAKEQGFKQGSEMMFETLTDTMLQMLQRQMESDTSVTKVIFQKSADTTVVTLHKRINGEEK